MITTPSITQFAGSEHRFLSNFTTCYVELNFAPVKMDGDDFLYPSVEHGFQAAKSLYIRARERVLRAPSPGRAKQIGRGLVLRADWETIRIEVMIQLIAQKFPVDNVNRLTYLLLRTADAELIEGNTWGDRFWGVSNGVGDNHLGKILMARREEVRRGLAAFDVRST